MALKIRQHWAAPEPEPTSTPAPAARQTFAASPPPPAHAHVSLPPSARNALAKLPPLGSSMHRDVMRQIWGNAVARCYGTYREFSFTARPAYAADPLQPQNYVVVKAYLVTFPVNQRPMETSPVLRVSDGDASLYGGFFETFRERLLSLGYTPR